MWQKIYIIVLMCSCFCMSVIGILYVWRRELGYYPPRMKTQGRIQEQYMIKSEPLFAIKNRARNHCIQSLVITCDRELNIAIAS